jgi:hypothetical protein
LSPRVAFTGQFDPAQIPTIPDSERRRSDVISYRKGPSPKAVALYPVGEVFTVIGAKSLRAAEEQALAACDAYRTSHHYTVPCFLYASNNQVVLDQRSNTPITP